jgi:hypothetical protein
MMRLEQELLKLKNAAYEQGLEEKRISETNYERTKQFYSQSKLKSFLKD